MGSRRGFSILELLVVAAIFAVVLALTSALFLRGRDAMELSTDKIDTAGRSRRALDSLTPLVAAAVEVGGFEALEVSDATPLDLTDACHLDVTTREDFLADDYTPRTNFDVRAPYYRFRIAFEPDSGELKLYELKLVPVEVDDAVAPRLLARDVMGCRFEALTPGSVSTTVRIKAQREDERRPGGVTTTMINAILVAPSTQ
jgi:prepilin-type N-terminal cleavage/methylation domain-containing protein